MSANGPEHVTAETGQAPIGGRTIVGGAWTVGGQIAPFLYTIVISIVAGRILGPSGLGRQSFIAFIVLVVLTVCSGGLTPALIRSSAQALGRNSPEALRGLASWGWRNAALGAFVGTAVLVAIAFLGAEPRAAWLFGAVAVAAGIVNKVPGAVLTGAQHWRQVALIVLYCGAGGAIATVIVLALGWGITGMVGVTAVSAVAMLIGSLWMLRRLFAHLPKGDSPYLAELRRSASRYALASSVTVVLTFVVAQRSEVFFLNRDSDNAQIAFYSIAFSAATILQTMLMGMTNVFSPTFARFFGAGQFDRIRSGYSRALRLLIMLAIPLALGGVVLGPPLIDLAYGAGYSEAGNVLRLLAVVVPFTALGAISTALLAAYGKMRFPIVVSAIAATADLAMAALLVPRLDAIGAAIANDTAVLAAATIQLVYCVRLLGGADLAPGRLVRMAIASAVAAAAAQGALEIGPGVGPFLLALVVGIALLCALAVALRVLSGEDAAWLSAALDDTPARRLGRICGRLSGGAATVAR